MSHITENIKYEGVKIKLTWIPAEDIPDMMELQPIMQCYGICYDEHDNVLIFKNSKGKWTLPGGTTEPNETPIDTLTRELMEEVDIEIEEDPIFLGAQKVYDADNFYKKGVNHYQLRFACKIKRMHPASPDPDNGLTYERKLVPHSEVLDYIKWENKIAKAIFDSAYTKIKAK
jgi:ADP-ribose pyrophosphatase YjhB (NUDIX family)